MREKGCVGESSSRPPRTAPAGFGRETALYHPVGSGVTVTAPTFHQVTVAIDGSQPAAEALDVAIDIARHYGSELCVIAVAPLIPAYIAPSEPMVPAAMPPSEIGRFRDYVEQAVARAKRAGVSAVSGVAYEGVVVDELLAHAEKHHTDLLVLGSRGLSAAKRILLGSVSTGVVTRAPCAVLVVRPAPAKAGG
jgi:nucleotide-binding universal stress UspA family protein